MDNQLHRKYGLFTAICMVVGTVIGSGIFFKAQTVLEKTGGDMPIGILSWMISGVIMLACLLTFSFMGQKYGKVNGVVDYAEATVGKRYGYYMGWFVTTIYYPSMTSALAWLSARYTLVFVTSVNPNFPMSIPAAQGGCVFGPECMALSLFYLCLAYGINTLSPKLAGKFQTSTTVIKLIPLCLMAVVGIIYGMANGTLPQNFAAQAMPENTAGNPLFAGVCATVFAYEGWIIATSINSELKDAKKNLPKALIIGGVIIVVVYIFYFLGVAGGATSEVLIKDGAQVAFTNIFGGVLGNILNLFVAVSCMGTLNGLMLGCSRGMYSIAVRGNGPASKVFAKVDDSTDMPTNSAVFALLVIAAWFLYFYATNLYLPNVAGVKDKPFMFDSTELPVITVYLMYIPIFLRWMMKEKNEGIVHRIILPVLASAGSAFMVIACIFSHGMACIWYLILFAAVMLLGWLLDDSRKRGLSCGK